MKEAKNKSTLVLIDESFIEFVKNYERNSMISYVMEYDNLIILRSMTKSFGLAGLRLGYLVANPNLITKINLNQIAWNVNGVAQIAGIEALNDQDHLVRAKKIIEKEKIRILKAIREKMKGLVAYNSEANFLLIKLKNKDSTWYKEELLKNYGILVRDCSSFRGMSKEFIRIAVRTPNENELLLTALENMEANINN
jgi:threonine-phosphate decarboxylase